MASLLLPASLPTTACSSSPTRSVHQNPRQLSLRFPPINPSSRKSVRTRTLTISFALAESDSPKSLDEEDDALSLLQELSDSFRLPSDYFAQLPRDLRLDLNDAAFDLANGPVLDECGQELGEMLLNLSRAWEQADTATSTSIASKFPSLHGSLTDNVKSAFGRRLVSTGRRFQSMGQYGQGELQRGHRLLYKFPELKGSNFRQGPCLSRTMRAFVDYLENPTKERDNISFSPVPIDGDGDGNGDQCFMAHRLDMMTVKMVHTDLQHSTL